MHAKPVTAPKVRCAIYTRKSSEEGLDQAFNSLHAQREACAAYVLSQAGEGWVANPILYDDGGFSGGNIERPGLQRLLADIAAGRIDVVVVYKVDRLTRSLTDFAKVVDQFDTAGVSFVSVTQAFNTTTSMGRLTLNVLLSFAQFEREVTGERIRDKIAASKAKGMWMGGCPPLGYSPPTDLTTRKLVVIEAEAQIVRLIFARYLELGSVHLLERWLAAEGIRSKAWTNRAGTAKGGLAFSRGALFHLLKSRLYLGEIIHRDKSVAGAHPAIVDAEVFAAVQAQLGAHSAARVKRQVKAGESSLVGRLYDRLGRPMTPVHARGKADRVYRYYVSAPLQRGGKAADDAAMLRLSAPMIEALVSERIAAMFGTEADESLRAAQRVALVDGGLAVTLLMASLVSAGTSSREAMVGARGRLGPGDRLEAKAGGLAQLHLAVEFRTRGGKTSITRADGRSPFNRSRQDQTLIRALQKSHLMLRDQVNAAAIGVTIPTDNYLRRLTRLAFLAPEIQMAILEGRQPPGLSLQALMDESPDLSWAAQRRKLGFDRVA